MPKLRLMPEPVYADTKEKCLPILEYLMKRGGEIAIDTETTGLDKFRSRVLFWSLATESTRYCFPVSVIYFFEPLFCRSDISWLLCNAKYDMHLLANAGIYLAGKIIDIIVEDALEDDTRPHGLKDQANLRYDGISWGEFKDLFLDARNHLNFDKDEYKTFKTLSVGDKLLYVFEQSPMLVINYASSDAFFTYLLHQDLKRSLSAEELAVDIGIPGFSTLWDYFNVIESPFTKVLWKMERKGVLVDQEYVEKLKGPMISGLNQMEVELYALAGSKVNLNSTPQLRHLLFGSKTEGGWDIKPIKYTKGGKGDPKTSTDDSVLEILESKLVGTHEGKFVKLLRDYRGLKKLFGTYVEGMKDLLGPDGRIHTSFNQAGARTARISSSDPNMQNWPRADNDAYGLRGAFIPPAGYDLVDWDYPQIEFRVAAVMADEEILMDSIRKGWDVHNANTVAMYRDQNLTYERVCAAVEAKEHKRATAEDKAVLKLRQGAKTVGFGTLFGEGPAKMAVQLGISKDEAKELQKKFFSALPNIKRNIKEMYDFAHAYGFTYTALGRKRRLHRINSGILAIELEEERQSYNTLIQGSAAEMVKLAMLQIDEDPLFEALGGSLLLAVHDEVMSEAPKETSAEVSELMQFYMGQPLHWGPIQIEYPVPVNPSGARGSRWTECH